MPPHFEQASEIVTEDMVAERIVAAPTPGATPKPSALTWRRASTRSTSARSVHAQAGFLGFFFRFLGFLFKEVVRRLGQESETDEERRCPSQRGAPSGSCNETRQRRVKGHSRMTKAELARAVGGGDG